MGFEQKVLTDVTNARAAAVAAGAQGPAQQAAAENALTGTLRSLFAVVENYPELKANENVLALQEQLTTTENQISFSRQHYNATVLDYNTNIQTFPSVLIAGSARLRQARLLRRRARGRDGAQRRPQPELIDRRGSRPWPPARSTARSPPTSGTRSCWPRSSSPSSPCSGSRIGYAITGSAAGAAGVTAFALALGSITGIGSYFSGDKLVLAVSQAHPVDDATAPQLMNVVREMAVAANVPMPAVYIIDDTAPNAFATGRDPAARLDRDHDRPAREARSRGAPGRHRPRAVARPELRHPVLAGRRGDGRRDRDPGRLLPAVHVLGRHGRSAIVEPRQRRQRHPGGRSSSSRSSSRSSPRSSAASSSWRSAASGSTSPTPRRSS